MLENEVKSKIGTYIIIGFLMAVIVFLVYQVGTHESDMKAHRIESAYTEAKNAELKEMADYYAQGYAYYEALFGSGLRVMEAGEWFLEEGTIIIPPIQESTEEMRG